MWWNLARCKKCQKRNRTSGEDTWDLFVWRITLNNERHGEQHRELNVQQILFAKACEDFLLQIQNCVLSPVSSPCPFHAAQWIIQMGHLMRYVWGKNNEEGSRDRPHQVKTCSWYFDMGPQSFTIHSHTWILWPKKKTLMALALVQSLCAHLEHICLQCL